MLRLIVVPLDGSAFGEQVLPIAVRLAERDRAELELVHVYESIPPYRTQGAPPLDPTLDAALKQDRAAYLQFIGERLRRSTAVSVTVTLLDGPVGATLAEHVAERRADLLVMATHGRGGLSRLWLGSVTSDLIRHSVAPLLLVRPDESGARAERAPAFARVLIPLDGSPEGEEAVEHAVAVARDPGVELVLAHVVVPVVYLTEPVAQAFVHETELESAAASYLEDVAGRLRARGLAVDTRILRHSQPSRAILSCAEEVGADLIAMETHGRGGLTQLLMGSVADKVVRAAPVPVLLHRPRAYAAPSAGQESGERKARGAFHA